MSIRAKYVIVTCQLSTSHPALQRASSLHWKSKQSSQLDIMKKTHEEGQIAPEALAGIVSTRLGCSQCQETPKIEYQEDRQQLTQFFLRATRSPRNPGNLVRKTHEKNSAKRQSWNRKLKLEQEEEQSAPQALEGIVSSQMRCSQCQGTPKRE
jgi:hypothetical protein